MHFDAGRLVETVGLHVFYLAGIAIDSPRMLATRVLSLDHRDISVSGIITEWRYAPERPVRESKIERGGNYAVSCQTASCVYWTATDMQTRAPETNGIATFESSIEIHDGK